MNETPFLAIGNNELKDLPDIELRKGDMITCPICNKKHVLKCGKDKDGNETDLLLFYNCKKNMFSEEKTYLASIKGLSIMNRKIGSGAK